MKNVLSLVLLGRSAVGFLELLKLLPELLLVLGVVVLDISHIQNQVVLGDVRKRINLRVSIGLELEDLSTLGTDGGLVLLHLMPQEIVCAITITSKATHDSGVHDGRNDDGVLDRSERTGEVLFIEFLSLKFGKQFLLLLSSSVVEDTGQTDSLARFFTVETGLNKGLSARLQNSAGASGKGARQEAETHSQR